MASKTTLKPVIQLGSDYKEIARYEGVIPASNVTGVDRSQIAHCASRTPGYISAGGYYWVWPQDFTDEWKPQEALPTVVEDALCPVYQIDKQTLGIVNKFPSLIAAAESTGLHACNISMACQFKSYKSSGGYYWVKEEEYYDGWEPPIYLYNRKILCLDKNGKIVKRYSTIKEIKEDLGHRAVQVPRCLVGKGNMAYGYYWVYEQNFSEWKPHVMEKPYRWRKVRCIETGIVYDSIKEAAEAVCGNASVGSTRVGIGQACRGFQNTSRGYHLEFIDKE